MRAVVGEIAPPKLVLFYPEFHVFARRHVERHHAELQAMVTADLVTVVPSSSVSLLLRQTTSGSRQAVTQQVVFELLALLRR